MSIQKSYVVCIYVQYTDILFRYKVPEPNTHVPHHTQRENDTTNGGGAEGAATIGTIGPPFVCGVAHVLASSTLYLNTMSVYCAYVHKHTHTHYI